MSRDECVELKFKICIRIYVGGAYGKNESGKSRGPRQTAEVQNIGEKGIMKANKLAYGALLGVMLHSPTWAQDKTTPNNASASSDVVPEIIVTAQRRSESLQSAPIAVSAITGKNLSATGTANVSDLQGLAPATQFQTNQNNSMNVSIRGITSTNIQIVGEAPISYNIDGVPITHAISQPGGLYDVDRIEVLRGPQGTLYGRNSTGGAVNIITKKPDPSGFDASVLGSYGNYQSVNLAAMVNLPLSENLAVRGSVERVAHDGYTDDGFNDQGTTAARLGVLYKKDAARFFIGGDYTKQKNNGSSFSVCPPGSAAAGPALATPAGVIIPNYCANTPWQPKVGAPRDSHNDANFNNVENYGLRAELNVDLPIGALTYIPGYRHVSQSSLGLGSTPIRLALTGGDYVHVGIKVLDDSNEVQSHELRLASNEDSKLRWLVGGFLLDDRVKDYRDSVTNLPMFGSAAETGIKVFSRERKHLRTKSAATFAQVTYPITEAVRLTGGLRYTRDKQSSRGSTNIVQSNGSSVPVDGNGNLSFEKFTWKVGVDADLSEHSLLFGSVSTGSKAGGFNPGALSTFPAESVTAYEGGIKNSFWNRRLKLNLTAFHYDYSNYQYQFFGTVYVNNPAAPGTTVPLQLSVTRPAKSVSISGAEFETGLYLPDGTIFDGSVSYLDASFKEFTNDGVSYSGNTLPYSPKWTITAGVQHKFDLGGLGTLTPELRTQYYTRQRTYYYDAPGSIQKSYVRTDVSLSWVDPSGKRRVSGWVRNVEDSERTTQYLTQSPFNSTVALMAPPRTYGITLSLNY